MTGRRTALVLFLTLIAGCNQPSQESASNVDVANVENEGKLWVKVERLDRRTCPSENCGIVGQLFFREAATPLESRSGWVRISKVYDAACEDGTSKYVDRGNSKCVVTNGITSGRFAEWVRADALVSVRPADPAETAKKDEKLVAQSDDFSKYRRAFSGLASKLIAEGRCSRADFEEMGGWEKSVTQYRDEPVYFTYCGGMTAANKIYINAKTETVLP